MISDKRVSLLADMMIVHIIYGRLMKALHIAQYLRRQCNWYDLDTSIHLSTGKRNYNGE